MCIHSLSTFRQTPTSVTAKVFLWTPQSKVVISDIDGTITKSDVLGHIYYFFGKDWSQSGVAKLFSLIKVRYAIVASSLHELYDGCMVVSVFFKCFLCLLTVLLSFLCGQLTRCNSICEWRLLYLHCVEYCIQFETLPLYTILQLKPPHVLHRAEERLRAAVPNIARDRADGGHAHAAAKH